MHASHVTRQIIQLLEVRLGSLGAGGLTRDYSNAHVERDTTPPVHQQPVHHTPPPPIHHAPPLPPPPVAKPKPISHSHRPRLHPTPLNSHDPDFLHNKKRVDTMDARKLKTRMGRITTPQKLLDTARIIASSGDTAKIHVAAEYFDKLRDVYGYDEEGMPID